MEQLPPFTEWKAFQEKLALKLDPNDTFQISDISFIGGCDISYKEDNNSLVAMISVHDFATLQMVYFDYVESVQTVEYVAGFLGFKEVPLYRQLIDKIREKEFFPLVFLVDGFGLLHHRKCGSASMLGIELDICTVGIGKSLLHLDGLDEKRTRAEAKKMKELGGYSLDLVGESGQIWGCALFEKSERPIYISIGHKISLPTAVEIVRKCCIHKIPEPIRFCDIKSRQLLK